MAVGILPFANCPHVSRLDGQLRIKISGVQGQAHGAHQEGALDFSLFGVFFVLQLLPANNGEHRATN